MAHPTCALARPPNAPSFDRTALAMHARKAFDALQEAYHAASCVRWLLVHVENVPSSHRYFTRTELKALHSVIDFEVERRLQIARTATASAPMP